MTPVVIVVLAKYWAVFSKFLESAEKCAPDTQKILVRDKTEEKWPEIDGCWTTIDGPEKFSMAGNGNLGLKSTPTGSDVIYCGDDARFISGDTVERLQEIAYSDPKIGLLSPRIIGRGSPSQVDPQQDLVFPRALEFWFPCVYIKREVFNRIGFLDEQFSDFGSDDLDFSIRAQLAGYKLAITRQIAVEHEASPEGGPTTFVKSIGAAEWQRQQAVAQEKLRAKYGVSVSRFQMFLNTGDVDLLRNVPYSVAKESDEVKVVAVGGAAESDKPTVMATRRTPQLGMRDKSLCVLTPLYGGMATRNYLESFTKLALLAQHINLEFCWSFVHNESLIPRARNRLADSYLKQTKATHSVFIDADIGFNPEDVMGMLELDQDIVGAICTKKNIRWDRIQKAIRKNGRIFTNEDLSRIGGDFVMNFDLAEGKTRNLNLGELQDMKQLGTGLLMVKREVYEDFQRAYPDRWYLSPEDSSALPGKIWDFFRSGINPDDKHYESEDYWFCNDCRAMGLKVMAAPWMVTDHMGTYTYKADLGAVAAMSGEL